MPLRIRPELKPRVWGGNRLGSNDEPIGEAWVVYEHGVVESDPWAGSTLGALSEQLGAWLLGDYALAHTASRFPLLIKLLDARDWLSVQVHPDDEAARRLEGPEHFGKTEAWHFLDVDPGAEIILGLIPGTTRERFAEAIRSGRTLDVIQRRRVQAGDTSLIPAGTVHALGPGLFLYEVQQTSDITYRVYDWDRPASAGRSLHIEQACAVVRPEVKPDVRSLPTHREGWTRLAKCRFFELDRLEITHTPATADTAGVSFHALTVIAGSVNVRTADGAKRLATLESALIPAAAGSYQIEAEDRASVLIARLAGPEKQEL